MKTVPCLSAVCLAVFISACTIIHYTTTEEFCPGVDIKAPTAYDFSKMKMEKLGRGVIAVRQSKDAVFVTWRYLREDPFRVAFNVYRDGKKINDKPITDVTWFIDNNAGGGVYSVKPVLSGKELKDTSREFTLADNAPIGYVDIPLDAPADGMTPAKERYTYFANECSVGDVDGDGELEIFLKWDPSNAHDNAHDGYTGNVYIDCLKIDGTKLWRIDLGKNIRAGAHYTQFMVADFDSNGKAELICKTADGTIDGTGKVIGDANANYVDPGSDMEQIPEVDFKKTGINPAGTRNRGRILSGPEYLSVFDGLTGKALDTVDYIPSRRDVLSWGDNYANRSDRYLACVAFLDGERPSAVMCRGYYTRAVLAAYDWDGKKLSTKWVFDSQKDGKEYEGQGNHNLFAADVDHDGKDEIVYGSCTIDHNGKGLYSTGFGHGDSLHITQFSLDLDGLQVLSSHEGGAGTSYRDAASGKVIQQIKSAKDVERCMAADIDPTNPGVELWSGGDFGYRNWKGELIPGDYSKNRYQWPNGLSANFAVWWDGDLLRELFDWSMISKYDWKTGKSSNIMTFPGCFATGKGTPAIVADIFGDWREEVVFGTFDKKHLRIYVSTIPTQYRFHTFLQDPVYRNSVASENTCYNQPTHTGFYFGADLIPAKDGAMNFFRGTILKKTSTQE